MTLPVAAEVDRRAAAHDQAHHRADLLAGAVPAMIFAPRQFPRIPDQVDPGDVMIVTDLAAQRAFPDHHDHLAPGAAVLRQPPVLAVRLAVLRTDVAAEIGPVYLDRPVSAAELQPPELQPHGLADLVRQDEGSLVLDIQVAR